MPESGLGQVEGTEMPQGTRPRALQPGTKASVPHPPAQQATLSVPSPSERCGEETKRRPRGLSAVSLAEAPGHSSASGLAVTLIDIVFHQSHHLFKLVL